MATAKTTETTTAAGAGSDSWLSPAVVTVLAGSVYRDVTLPAAAPAQICQLNTRRVGFLVIRSSGLISFPRIGPRPDVQTYGLRETNTDDVKTFLLADWLSLITGEWWAFSTNGGDVRVYEFLRPTLGR